MLWRIKSLQDVNGTLAAENGLLKAERIRVAAEARGASAQRGEPNTQLPQQWAGTVFPLPATGEQQQPQENNAPQTTNVGLRGIQVLRDKLSVGPFKPEETIRTHGGTLGHLAKIPPEQLFAGRRGMFSMPSKPGFLLQDAWNAIAVWAKGVGEMGLTEGLQRIGARAYNRRRLLHAKSARLGMQAESPGGALKGPRREEGPHHQTCLKARKQQAPAPSNARCFRCGRVGHHSSTRFA
ncbi:hypothetical protein TRVL_08748 [Trypanosoma vivax]|nr:hypothetical protein TRVL_08748 [Trypanosoma vivax]